MNANGTRAARTMPRLLLIMLPALALVALTYLPPFNPFHFPERAHFDLTGSVALAAYWVAESGGVSGIPYAALLMTPLVVCRAQISWKQRLTEAVIILLAVAVFLGVPAYVNEHFIKPLLAVPRPNIQELASMPPDAPALKMSAAEFYAMPDKAARSEYLEKILTPELKMHEKIRGHWIVETGYSFPSGHAFASMMFATLFLGLGLRCFEGRRLWFFYVLVLWAVAVCYSRPILRVHSPTDVIFGGLEGILAGSFAFFLVRRVVPTAS